MYDTLEDARVHAIRATGIHCVTISIVREPNGFTLHADPPPDADVVEVIDYTP